MSRLLLAAARLFVGGLFLYAATTKLSDMAAFAVSVANYRLLPEAMVPVAATAVVGVEVVTGALLVLGIWLRAAALVASAVLAAFTVGLSQALLRGIDLECGCFGAGDQATWLTVLRDCAFLLPALAVVVFGKGSPAGGEARTSPACSDP